MGGYEQVVNMKNEAMIENKKRLIYIDQTTVKAMEATDPVRFASLVAPKSDSIYGEGPVDSRQITARPLLNTGKRVWLVIIHSMHTSYGLGTDHSDTTRIDGLIKNITLLDILRQARWITQEHAEQERRRMMATLIIWEGFNGDFGLKKKIEALHLGIHIGTQHGFAAGKYVNSGVQAVGNKLSGNVGMNAYYVIHILVKLGIDRFADMFELVTGVEFNTDDVRETMDMLMKSQGNLGKRSEDTKNAISRAKTGKKQSEQHKTSRRNSLNSSAALLERKQQAALRKDERNSAYNALLPRFELEEGNDERVERVTGVSWDKSLAVWQTQLPRRYSDCYSGKATTTFDHLLDANAAMRALTQELDRDLKGRVTVGHNGRPYWRYDGTVERNRQVVSEAIAKMKKTAKELQEGRVKQNTNIISADE
jgi:hypothetical protein